jgi:hypothetical protein
MNLTFDIVNTDEDDLSNAVSMGHHVRNAAIICNSEDDFATMVQLEVSYGSISFPSFKGLNCFE